MRSCNMPSKYALNVSITEHLCAFVEAQVASGRFGTASEVVRAGLRLLERDLGASASYDRPTGVRPDPAVAAADPEEAGRFAGSGKAP
jgi:antitoxin ParD1/3/4